MRILDLFFRNFVRFGYLTVIDPTGKRHSYSGRDLSTLSPCTIRLRGSGLTWRFLMRPSLALGEAYMDGRMIMEEGTLYDLLALASENASRWGEFLGPGDLFDLMTRRIQQWNPVGASRRNVAHHYDLSDTLYDLFLDQDRQYSCAYFPTPDLPLDEAQERKKRHILDKLRLAPGQRILDIGCGWGGLALALAREANVTVTGITLSERQLAIARRRATEAGLSHRVTFELTDYRQLRGQFDRIVSVGMFEHVGIDQYAVYFRQLGRLLTAGGIALLHAIGRNGRPSSTDPWIRKYIFPGGYCPSMSEVFPAIEKSGLFTTDLEIIHPCHYADTLRHWRQRFCRQWSKAAAHYDDRFCRMWEFYLAGSEATFRHRNMMVFQLQMAKSPHCVPSTRDYMMAGIHLAKRTQVAE